MPDLSGVAQRLRSRVVPIVHELRYRRRRDREARRPGELAADAVVSILCVSNRPAQLEHIIGTWQSQQLVVTELILVTNADGYAEVARDRLAHEPGATVVETDPAMTLGAALNAGIEQSRGAVIAKIDDDDHYTRTYAADGLELLRTTRAGVGGKQAHFVYLADTDRTIIRFEDRANQRVGRVAGGTIMIHRDVLADIVFPDVSLGEDTEFARRAERAGWAVVAGDAAGYLQMRHAPANHTWQVDGAELGAGARVVGPGNVLEYWQS